MELIQATKQRVWEWPGVANFFLGGMATGFYLLSSLLMLLQSGVTGLSQFTWFKLVAPMLTSLGFLALVVEAGHPLRSRHLLRDLYSSWMSRETLAASIFIPAAILDWLYPNLALWDLAAVAAMGLMISHGFIVYRVRGVTAWNVPLMLLLFLTTGFATGSGLMLLASLDELTFTGGAVTIGLVCVVLDLAVWCLYLYGSQAPAFWEATEALRRRKSLIFSVGLGHLFPALLLLLLLVASGIGAVIGLWRVFSTLAGLAIIAGGIVQKAGIILEAGYLRGIKLDGLKSDAQGTHPIFSFVPSVTCREETVE